MKTENEKVNFETAATEAETETAYETETTEDVNGTAYMPEAAAIEKAIRSSVYASMGIGIVPLPLLNVTAVTASNLNLARKLSNLYGVEFKEGAARKIITAVIGAGVSTLATPLIGSAVIGIPLIGLPMAVGTKSVLNGMTTYALGRMFVTHFERGGSFLGANMEAMKEDFKTAFKNSREWLGNVVGGKKEAPENA